MKKILLLALTLITVVASYNPTFAQKKRKVLKKSERHAPSWVNGLEEDFIIVVGSGSDIEQAQQNALNKVKERIVTSIAENIKTSSDYQRKELTANNVSNFFENYETNTKTQSADIAFVKGISLSKASAFYWEEVRESNSSVRAYYHIKYPFSKFRLKKLINEFEKADRKLTEQLTAITDNIDNINSIEEIINGIKELGSLKESFIDQRKKTAELGIIQLKSKLKSIAIVPIDNTLGEIVYTLKIGDKIVTTARKPRVTSKCAKIISTLNNQDSWTISYDYSNCYEDPDNCIKVEYNFSGVKVKNQFNFNINAKKIDIFIHDDINFSALEQEDSTVTRTKCNIAIVSKYDTPFIIEKIILKWKGLSPVIIDNINMDFQGKGNHDLELFIEQPLEKEAYSAKKQSLISGSIHYSSTSGEKRTYKLYNQQVTTNW
ncbi:MAG: hypothetical protein IMY72_06980 [Bacteroidetes bacterium]|nr:hypothetical protein [Bacteroidota bacterium]